MKSRGTLPIEWIARPFQQFVKYEASGGILLIGCTIAALVWANSPWSASYLHLWNANLPLTPGCTTFAHPLHFWINEGLMALFFLLVGLEIKRETLVGELASFQKAALPVAAAIGGMLVPAILYASLNHGGGGRSGWGIPMATDIAFAVGVLMLLGNRVPIGLRVFLVALAIVDDLGAVLVIAFFYTSKLSLIYLGAAALIFLILIVLNRTGIRHPIVYIVLGLLLWVAFLNSGIHATVAGVLLAMAIPAGGGTGESLMLRFEHTLAPWSKYLIMPVFALANAGIPLGSKFVGELTNSIALGVICGLVLGKPIGITLVSWAATRIGWASLPTAVRWRQIVGVGALAGIGFTMSLFIANLAFRSAMSLETAKIGILTASLMSAIGGTLILLKKQVS